MMFLNLTGHIATYAMQRKTELQTVTKTEILTLRQILQMPK